MKSFTQQTRRIGDTMTPSRRRLTGCGIGNQRALPGIMPSISDGAVGQAEHKAMLERQCEGIVRAKREGRYKDRMPIVHRQAARSSGSRMPATGQTTAVG